MHKELLSSYKSEAEEIIWGKNQEKYDNKGKYRNAEVEIN